MVAGDGGFVPKGVHFGSRQDKRRTAQEQKYTVHFGSRRVNWLDLNKGISYNSYNNGGNMNTNERISRYFKHEGGLMFEDNIKIPLGIVWRAALVMGRENNQKIKTAEMNEEWETLQAGLDKFSKLNPSAYMTLLD
jgi:hypothetical protein